MGLRAIGLDVLHAHGFDAPCMVDEDLGVDAELLVERLLGSHGKLAHGVDAHAREPAHGALADTPEISERLVVPEGRLVALLVELAKEVGAVLCRDVEGDLGEVEVGSDATACGDARGGEHVGADALAELARRASVEREVVSHVHEDLVDGVDVDVLRREVLEVDAVDVGGALHVERHARRRHDVVEILGDLEHAAAVAHAERLHRRRDGQADGLFAALGIGDHEARGHGVEAALDALDARVEALEVDAEVVSVLGCHGAAPTA